MTRTRTPAKGAAAGFAAALFALASPGLAQSTPAASWQANDDDFLLLQLSVGKYKLQNDVRGYQVEDDICLDLADVIQSLDLPIRLDRKSRRATGWLFSEDRKFVVDRAAATVQNVNNSGEATSAPLQGDILDTPEGWCVRTEALSRWFGITFKPDLFNAAIRLESEEKLPFIEALERKSRAARLRPRRAAFDLSKYPHADMEYKVWRTPSADVNLRLGYDAPSSGSSTARAKAEMLVAGELAGASYTARVATDQNLVPSSARLRMYRYDRDGGLLGPLQATQVAAGDVETLAGQLTAQTAVGRGVFVSNRPLGRGSRFSTTTLRGTLPAGWDAELYRNGQLIAFQDDTADGRYEFVDVDLFYGRNDLEVVLYGPQGQIRREKVDVPVGRNHVEPGRNLYWAGVLQADTDLLGFLGNKDAQRDPAQGTWRLGAGFERGIDQRTSIAAGLQSLVLGGRRRNYAEARLLRTLGGAQVELSAANEFGAGSIVQAVGAGRLGTINLDLRAVKTFGTFASELVSPDLDASIALRADTVLDLGAIKLPLQAGIGHSTGRSGSKVTDWLISSAINTRRLAVTAQLEGQHRYLPETGKRETDIDLRLLGNTRLFGVRLRGTAGFTLSGPEKGFDYARLSVTERLDDRSDLRGEVEYQARAGSARFRAGYTRRFDRFALRADATFGDDGSIGAALSLAFSLGPAADGGFRMSETRLARLGQADVTVFRDDDGDGRFTDADTALPEVNVEAGLRLTDATTDEHGRALVDDLKPFAPVLVGIDESTLPDPFLVPATKGVVVTPRPGVSAKVAIAVLPSGEVEGSLRSAAGVPVEGVELELVDERGAVTAVTLSEYDGFFLFERVPYGKYRLQVAQSSARKLEVATSLGEAITVSRDRDLVRAGVVTLTPSAGSVIARSDPVPERARPPPTFP